MLAFKNKMYIYVTEQSESTLICGEAHNKWNHKKLGVSEEIRCKGLKDWAERLWGSWQNWKQELSM